MFEGLSDIRLLTIGVVLLFFQVVVGTVETWLKQSVCSGKFAC